MSVFFRQEIGTAQLAGNLRAEITFTSACQQHECTMRLHTSQTCHTCEYVNMLTVHGSVILGCVETHVSADSSHLGLVGLPSEERETPPFLGEREGRNG